MMKKLLFLLFAFLLFQPAMSHYKASFYVIVDMDGGTDDLRALSMMLATPEIEVIAVTTTGGEWKAVETAQRVRALLREYGHEGIPVGVGQPQSHKDSKSLPGAVPLIRKSIELEDMPVDFVALGRLTNLTDLLAEDPAMGEKLRRVYWYSIPGEEGKPSQSISDSRLTVDRIGISERLALNTTAFREALDTGITRYTKAVGEMIRKEPEAYAGSDCVPVYMLFPELFEISASGEDSLRRVALVKESSTLPPSMVEILESDREDKSIIFSSFPVNPDMFEEDVSVITPLLIEKHGLKEWKIVLITNEFHEHLGIYSILGAKMGLRAREYFHVGIDKLEILSFAGSSPPISCLNDGLQVSTGATMGHGTISLSVDENDPRARFSFKDRVIEIRIKENIREQILADVGTGVMNYGFDSTEYWAYIRELALKYWLELDRTDIFEISVIQ